SQARQHQTGAHHVVPVPHLLGKLDALAEERLCPLHFSLQEGNLPHHIERESNLPLRAHYSNKGLHFLYEDTCLRELPLPERGPSVLSHLRDVTEVPLIRHQQPLSDERIQTQGSRCCLLPGQTPLQKAASLARIPACDP